LIATHTLDGFLRAGIDTMVVDGYQNLPQTINTLIASQDLQKRYAQNGQARFHDYLTDKAVGEQYLQIINEAIT